MKVAKISKKLIKPQTPTPQNLKNYYISFLDQQQAAVYEGVVLFYQPYSKPENDFIQQLEESLAKILVQFYPLSGRYIKNDHMVDCSDQGAEFVEAEALDIELMELVAKTESAEQLKDLFPDQYFRDHEAAASSPLLLIQATHFPCRGRAISICVSHRVFDLSSFMTFISMWTNACSNNGALIAPTFDLPSLLQRKDMNVVDKQGDYKNVLKKFVFNKEALTSLKSRVPQGLRVSRVRVVCAVIAKALIGVDRAKHGQNRDLYIHQPINLRERTIPPQPKHACGNFSLPSLTPRVAAASTIGIEKLVDEMGDAVRKSMVDYVEILSPHRDGREIIANKLESLNKAFENSETNFITFSDWSKFGFYEADFGWGQPIWVGIGLQEVHSNCTVLMSNKEGDGIEAWVHLNKNDMRYFEHDPEIRFLATS